MPASQWIERLLASTRGRVIALLRRSQRTVNELAAEIGVSDNAIRSHLAALERDGLIEQHVASPKGVGKPSHVYALTPEADALLPKAYAPVLSLLLSTLAERMEPEELEGLLHEVGRRAAAGRSDPSVELRMRIDAAYGVLGEMGGVADIEDTGDAVVIRGYSCPVAALVPEHPQICHMTEALLSELVGVPVQEHCVKGERPRCRFVVPLADNQQG